ncbi:DUF4411 family protein [Magnetovibrio sp. PR-2]|uniref:DUF4411 family protein n=1 Tax=Magnetovibrio sp. PR-2 TaxID=3120356 RepID=UPI002FCE1858
MKRYCVDTSGFSNPLETMPEDIYSSLWQAIYDLIEQGVFAVTPEIYDELILIDGEISNVIEKCEDDMVLEVNDPTWEWQSYVENSNQMNVDHHDFISEYNGNLKGTVGLNDISIIALAKTLELPVISMEVLIQTSPKKRRIPNVCKIEDVTHLTFNDFLRAEGISL